MRHVLSRLDYTGRDASIVGEPDPCIVGPAASLLETGEQADREFRGSDTGRSRYRPFPIPAVPDIGHHRWVTADLVDGDGPGGRADRPVVGPRCPFIVERPASVQRWESLTFVHWPFEPRVVSRGLPPELAVDTYDGQAWVSLVPFAMRVATGGGRAVPWASTFPETNVRTYVVDGRGRRGVWFFSLDAARLGAVLVARVGFRLPYVWSSMSLSGTSTGTSWSHGTSGSHSEIRYLCRRRWPGPRAGAPSIVRCQVGAAYRDDELSPLDHFLTARWRLYSSTGRTHRSVPVSHDPWPLFRARATELDDHLLRAAGLAGPLGEPLVHYSPGVEARIGRPERYR